MAATSAALRINNLNISRRDVQISERTFEVKILIRKLQTESMNMIVELHPAPEQLPSFTEVDERSVGLLSGVSTP